MRRRRSFEKNIPGNPAGWATLKMNTLNEEEMTAVVALGDPVASWPVTPFVPPAPAWPGLGSVGGRDPLSPRMTDS